MPRRQRQEGRSVAEASTSGTLAAEADDAPERRFGRLRDRAEAQPPPPAEVSPTAGESNGDGTVPFDSAKTYIGVNGTYYDERWRWMEWRGKLGSWNRAAALSFGGWFAYRRQYGWALLSIVWLNALLAMAMTGGRLRLLGIALVVVALLTGRYANAIYRQSFRRAAVRVGKAESDPGRRIAALRRAGGTDRIAVWLMAVAVVASLTGLVWTIRATVGVGFVW
jgi:hypothetical protein